MDNVTVFMDVHGTVAAVARNTIDTTNELLRDELTTKGFTELKAEYPTARVS
jgi:hypothetical protein